MPHSPILIIPTNFQIQINFNFPTKITVKSQIKRVPHGHIGPNANLSTEKIEKIPISVAGMWWFFALIMVK